MGKKSAKKPATKNNQPADVEDDTTSAQSNAGDEDEEQRLLMAILMGGAGGDESSEADEPAASAKSKKQKKEEMRAAKQNKGKKNDKKADKKVAEVKEEKAVEAAAESESDDEAPQVPLRMVYCPICTFPPEMCEYGGMFANCKEHWEANPDAPGAAAALGGSGGEDKGRKRQILTAGEKAVAAVSKGGRKAVAKEVLMNVEKRQGRKFNTHISGLEFFGVDLKEACTKIKKALATGATVNDDPVLRITVQGDVVRDLATIIPDRLGVPADALYLINGASKTQLRPLTGCIDISALQTKPEKKPKYTAPVVEAQQEVNLNGEVRAVAKMAQVEESSEEEEEEEEDEEAAATAAKNPFKAAKKVEVVASRKPRFEVDDDGNKIMAPSFVPSKNRNKRK